MNNSISWENLWDYHTNWGTIFVKKKKSIITHVSSPNYGEIFQYPGINVDTTKEQIQQQLIEQLPVVNAGYIIIIDHEWNIWLQWSDKLQIGKPFGGKGPEAALVQILADAYSSIGSSTLASLTFMNGIKWFSKKDIVRLLHREDKIFKSVSEDQLWERLNIVTHTYDQPTSIRKIQELANIKEMRPLFIRWLWLEKKSVRDNIIRVLGILPEKLKKIPDIKKYLYDELLLFEPERLMDSALREFEEEFGWRITETDRLQLFYTVSDIKSTSSYHNYLKVHYNFLIKLEQWETLDSIATKGKQKYSLSEKDQELKTIKIPIWDAYQMQYNGITTKLTKGNYRKLSSWVTGLMKHEAVLQVYNTLKSS